MPDGKIIGTIPERGYFAAMRVKNLMIHGFWAAAMLAAFWLGTLRKDASLASDSSGAGGSVKWNSDIASWTGSVLAW